MTHVSSALRAPRTWGTSEVVEITGLRRSAFSCQVVGVLAAVCMDVNQCERVVRENAPVIVDTVGIISEDHAVHRVFLAVEAVHVSGREKERRTGLEDARDARNGSNPVL